MQLTIIVEVPDICKAPTLVEVIVLDSSKDNLRYACEILLAYPTLPAEDS